MNLMQSIDNMILLCIQNHMHTGFFDKVLPVISALGSGAAIWIMLALVFIFTGKYRRSGFIMMAALLISAFLGEMTLKPLFARVRPCDIEPGIALLIPRPGGFSFPSGHTMSAFAAAAVLYDANKSFGAAAYLLAALIAFSRLYLYVHYPSDVLGGMVLGILTGIFSLYVFNLKGKENSK